MHGIPDDVPLKEGDIVSLDLGITHKGLITDMAVTVPVGKVDKTAANLISSVREALESGINVARAGKESEIFPMQSHLSRRNTDFPSSLNWAGMEWGTMCTKSRSFLISDWQEQGHFGSGDGACARADFNEGGASVKIAGDGYTYKTRDGKRSAHYEKTILITAGAAEILTP